MNWIKLTCQSFVSIALAVAVTPLARGEDVFSDVPEASGYNLVYTLSIPNTADFSTNAVPYTTNNAASIPDGSFSRVAYYLQLQPTGGGATQWVYASMDTFTTDPTQLGVPVADSFQRDVLNLHIYSSAGSGLTTGTFASGGNIEFWPNDYAPTNAANVSGASNSNYDTGDQDSLANHYGSMQVHNHATNQTLLAYNQWGGDQPGTASDLGIGNAPAANTDWTFANNAASYSVKSMQILVKPGARPKAVNIMPLGDSITDGVGSAAGGGYRTKLFQDQVDAGVLPKFVGSATDNNSSVLAANGQLNHEGHSGYRTDQILNNLNGNDGTGGNNGGFWLAPGNGVNPNYVLLLIGTNDLAQGVTPTAALSNLSAIISEIATLRPNAQILVSNLLPRTDNAGVENEIVTDFNPDVPTIVSNHDALGQHVSFVDLFDVIDPQTDLSDGLHPNDVGYAKMADAWNAQISALEVPEPDSLALICFTVPLLARRRRRIEAI